MHDLIKDDVAHSIIKSIKMEDLRYTNQKNIINKRRFRIIKLSVYVQTQITKVAISYNMELLTFVSVSSPYSKMVYMNVTRIRLTTWAIFSKRGGSTGFGLQRGRDREEGAEAACKN